MKIIRHLIVMFTTVLFMTACESTPNHKHEAVNSTESGSGAVSNSDMDVNKSDTLSPSQPNGMDTTGEQTGRMNNTPGNKSKSNAQNLDTGINKTSKQGKQ